MNHKQGKAAENAKGGKRENSMNQMGKQSGQRDGPTPDQENV